MFIASPAFSRRTRPTRHDRGFTFIELLIVVLVVAIVAGAAVPMFRDTDATRVRGAAQVLVADLGYAQVESIAHGDDLRVVVFEKTGYRIATTGDPDTPITNPVGKLPYEVTFGESRMKEFAGVVIDDYDLGGDDRIQFGLYGQLDQTTAASVTLRCNEMSVTVTINPVTGETSIGAVE